MLVRLCDVERRRLEDGLLPLAGLAQVTDCRQLLLLAD